MSSVLTKSSILLIPFLFGGQPTLPAENHYLCQSPPLSVSYPPGLPVGTVSLVYFASTRLKESSGGLTFRNLLNREVLAFELVIEYQDQDGHPLLEIPYVATTPNGQQALKGQLRSETAKNLKNGIPVGKTVYVISESFNVVRTCPVKARLTSLHVLFDDGQVARWEMENWRTEPQIMEIPMTVEFSCDSENLYSYLQVRLTISSDGKVSDIQLPARPDWACLQSLRKTLQTWFFYPALQNGKPSESNLNLLLRLDRGDRRRKQDYGWVDPQEITGPGVVVDLVQADGSPSTWICVYGPRPFGFTPN